jgi:hypothetical protein
MQKWRCHWGGYLYCAKNARCRDMTSKAPCRAALPADVDFGGEDDQALPLKQQEFLGTNPLRQVRRAAWRWARGDGRSKARPRRCIRGCASRWYAR